MNLKGSMNLDKI